jgi:hypothetical protein
VGGTATAIEVSKNPTFDDFKQIEGAVVLWLGCSALGTLGVVGVFLTHFVKSIAISICHGLTATRLSTGSNFSAMVLLLIVSIRVSHTLWRPPSCTPSIAIASLRANWPHSRWMHHCTADRLPHNSASTATLSRHRVDGILPLIAERPSVDSEPAALAIVHGNIAICPQHTGRLGLAGDALTLCKRLLCWRRNRHDAAWFYLEPRPRLA